MMYHKRIRWSLQSKSHTSNPIRQQRSILMLTRWPSLAEVLPAVAAISCTQNAQITHVTDLWRMAYW